MPTTQPCTAAARIQGARPALVSGLVFSLAWLLPLAPAFAQGASAPVAMGSASGASGATATVIRSALARGDLSFISDAAQGGMAEVALGKLAQQRASDPQVKRFGEQMAQDHGKANEQLMALAAAKGVTPPAAPSRAQERDAQRLAKLSGAEFDRAYMEHMVDDHKKDVSAFRKASKSAADAEVKAFAARTLPTLESHLQMAQTAYETVRKAGGAGARGRGAASGAASNPSR